MFAPQFRPLTLKKFEKNIFRFSRNLQSINFSSASSSKKFNFESENVLERFIIDRIRSTGPISVSEYMKLCVSSQYGYYAQKVFLIFKLFFKII